MHKDFRVSPSVSRPADIYIVWSSKLASMAVPVVVTAVALWNRECREDASVLSQGYHTKLTNLRYLVLVPYDCIGIVGTSTLSGTEAARDDSHDLLGCFTQHSRYCCK